MSSGVDELRERASARVGTTVGDKYVIDRLLGIGGMASVYAATHRNGRRVALKLLHPELSIREDIRTRFRREGQASNAVNHPGVVEVIDDDIAPDGAAFLVMELLHGTTIEQLWEDNGRKLSPRIVLAIARELCAVLAVAHRAGIVHRDLKPENLFLTDDGRLKVLDFGLARVRDAARPKETTTGMVFGTPAFMAPEQANGLTREIDARSDLWAVGATMFTLLSGATVHEGQSAQHLVILHATKPARSLATVMRDASPALVDLVDRALASDPHDRFATAEAMMTAIRNAGRLLYADEVLELLPPQELTQIESFDRHSSANGDGRMRRDAGTRDGRSAAIGVATGASSDLKDTNKLTALNAHETDTLHEKTRPDSQPLFSELNGNGNVQSWEDMPGHPRHALSEDADDGEVTDPTHAAAERSHCGIHGDDGDHEPTSPTTTLRELKRPHAPPPIHKATGSQTPTEPTEKPQTTKPIPTPHAASTEARVHASERWRSLLNALESRDADEDSSDEAVTVLRPLRGDADSQVANQANQIQATTEQLTAPNTPPVVAMRERAASLTKEASSPEVARALSQVPVDATLNLPTLFHRTPSDARSKTTHAPRAAHLRRVRMFLTFAASSAIETHSRIVVASVAIVALVTFTIGAVLFARSRQDVSALLEGNGIATSSPHEPSSARPTPTDSTTPHAMAIASATATADDNAVPLPSTRLSSARATPSLGPAATASASSLPANPYLRPQSSLPTPSASTPMARRPRCEPPYELDANGVKHWKLECLRSPLNPSEP